MDPWELPGLTHFCEHMLFLGTDKYPSENEYEKFISAHGGMCNAFTSDDHTNYHFDIAPEHLHVRTFQLNSAWWVHFRTFQGALDRLAQFFLSPLFTESATEREVMAIDSENSNNLQNDAWRLDQLERYQARVIKNRAGGTSKKRGRNMNFFWCEDRLETPSA